jgi:hypothetical protein
LIAVSGAEQPRLAGDGGLVMGGSKTIGEYMELRPGEPIVLKFFTAHDVLNLALKFSFQGLDEEAQERVGALQTVIARATSDKPPHCVICQDVTVFPGLIGYARSASKSEVGAVVVICMPCSSGSSEAVRANVLAALGEEELKTSNLPS